MPRVLGRSITSDQVLTGVALSTRTAFLRRLIQESIRRIGKRNNPLADGGPKQPSIRPCYARQILGGPSVDTGPFVGLEVFVMRGLGILPVVSLVLSTLFSSPLSRAGEPPAAASPPSASPASTASKTDLAVQRTKLANGLEVILHEDHRTPIVSVNLWYHAGSKDEPEGRNGFAHLFEHMMFQGSKHVAEDMYFRYLERVGATDINGTTSTDRTNYFETIPKNQLELALWLESDRMGFLLDHVDEKSFESQRSVVKNERRQSYENRPYGLVPQYVSEALYPKGHPYHRLTIGTPRDLDAATLEDVKAFFRTYYVPNNATLVVAGDVDPKKTLALVEKYFGPVPGAPIPCAALANPRQGCTGAPRAIPAPGPAAVTNLEVAANVELPRVEIAWNTPSFFQPGDAELDFLSHVLSSGKTSRLYKRLVYDMRIAQDVYAYQSSRELGSQFEIGATAQPGHTADELFKAIEDELDKLRKEGLRSGELARARAEVTSGLVFEIEKNGGRANMLNTYNHYTGKPDYLKNDLARYEAINEAGVQNAAKNFLGPKRVITKITPDKTAPIFGVLRSINGQPAPPPETGPSPTPQPPSPAGRGGAR
jgi:predicted Zn-dependent peptidase